MWLRANTEVCSGSYKLYLPKRKCGHGGWFWVITGPKTISKQWVLFLFFSNVKLVCIFSHLVKSMLPIFNSESQAVAGSTFLELIYGPQKAAWRKISLVSDVLFFFFWITLYLIEIVKVFSMGILHTDWTLPWNLFSNAYFMISILKPQNLWGKKYILYLCGLFNKLEVDELKHLPLHLIQNTFKNDTWDIWKWHRTTAKLLKEKKISSLNIDLLMRTF